MIYWRKGQLGWCLGGGLEIGCGGVGWCRHCRRLLLEGGTRRRITSERGCGRDVCSLVGQVMAVLVREALYLCVYTHKVKNCVIY